MLDSPRRSSMMHSHHQKPFNHRKEVDPGFGLGTHFCCCNVPHWSDTCHVSWFTFSWCNQQTGILWLLFPQSCRSNPYLENTESNSALKAQIIFIYTMTFPVLAKFQLTAFDLRKEMYRAPTMLLELCNWPIYYILKIIIWLMGSKLSEVIRLSVLQVQHLFSLEFDSFTKLFIYSKQLSCFLCP